MTDGPSIAYLISAHTDAPQLGRLIRALQRDAQFFIHIDAKSDISAFDCVRAANVHFIPDRVNVRWGTLLEVEYQMNLIRAAVRFAQHFDRIFFLSGMDYPIWSAERISAWLREQQGRELLQGICIDTPEIGERQKEMYTVARPFLPSQKLSILAIARNATSGWTARRGGSTRAVRGGASRRIWPNMCCRFTRQSLPSSVISAPVSVRPRPSSRPSPSMLHSGPAAASSPKGRM